MHNYVCVAGQTLKLCHKRRVKIYHNKSEYINNAIGKRLIKQYMNTLTWSSVICIYNTI